MSACQPFSDDLDETPEKQQHQCCTLLTPKGTKEIGEKVVSIDVSQAAEEGQRAQSVGVSDPHVAGHPLDQTCETLQLGHHVV
ncbi:hypothetical protein EYF80_025760 [Liparis tanakae]|uniref:Uncharacterized protein n=1 Tax=Liparis tanakae TaxID=230148 RepID=A0A4Z2HDT8_9TELE|nr:hypothetical protein EYF80_025760 [Liparis tanakae]